MRTKPLAKNPTAPREPEKPLNSGSRVAPSLAAAATLCVAGVAGSCTPSESTVRPGPPEPQQCPQVALDTMRKEFGIHYSTGYARMLDVFAMPGYDVPTVKMNYQDAVTVTEGRQEVRLISHRGPPKKGLPKKSVLVGDFFIRDRLYARFNEVVLPDGTRLPFCAELVDPMPPYNLGLPFEPGSKPGAWTVRGLAYVYSSDLTY
jgi:eukaryotic-like serine/threonine-protein kinase